MKSPICTMNTLLASTVASLLLVACAAAPTAPEGSVDARNKLTQLQSDSRLATRAPVAIKEAELAVRAAEQPQKDKEMGEHLVFIADRKVDIASALAQSRLSVDERDTLSEQRESARLDSRTQEVDRARSETEAARMDTAAAQKQNAAAQKQNAALQNQIAELNAKVTDRGLVVTLGDLLFANNKSELKSGAARNLDKLRVFLSEYKERTVLIEGYTDSVGSEVYNMNLSHRRADSVKAYLVKAGIASGRLVTSGKGEASPVASNATASGRQQNRRVEVIIANVSSAAR